MRDRWLRDAFAVSLPLITSESEQINHNEHRSVATTNSIDEEEALRLLIDYGIAEDKVKVRLQVNIVFFFFINKLYIYLLRKFKQLNLKIYVDFFQRKNLLMYLKNYQLDRKYIIYLSGKFYFIFFF
jgi:hypothetical protein